MVNYDLLCNRAKLISDHQCHMVFQFQISLQLTHLLREIGDCLLLLLDHLGQNGHMPFPSAAIRLQHLREIRHITQERIANSMGISQAALSRLERRPNITIGALQRYVEALGGRLEVRAVFKEETQQILE